MREKYSFDAFPFVKNTGCTLYGPVWEDGSEFWYLTGGANNGCRVLIEMGGGEIGVGAGLHAIDTVRCTIDQEREIRRAMSGAADQGNIKPDRLLKIAEVPGFSPDAHGRIYHREIYHRDGWYTRSRFALEIGGPAWAPDARAFDIREGVYIVFADGSCRLVPKREYHHPQDVELDSVSGCPPDYRQGDLLLFACDAGELEGDEIEADETTSEFDRHLIKGKRVKNRVGVWADPTITHPEHAPLEVGGVFFIILAPGRSRPFSQGGRD